MPSGIAGWRMPGNGRDSAQTSVLACGFAARWAPVARDPGALGRGGAVHGVVDWLPLARPRSACLHASGARSLGRRNLTIVQSECSQRKQPVKLDRRSRSCRFSTDPAPAAAMDGRCCPQAMERTRGERPPSASCGGRPAIHLDKRPRRSALPAGSRETVCPSPLVFPRPGDRAAGGAGRRSRGRAADVRL